MSSSIFINFNFNATKIFIFISCEKLLSVLKLKEKMTTSINSYINYTCRNKASVGK